MNADNFVGITDKTLPHAWGIFYGNPILNGRGQFRGRSTEGQVVEPRISLLNPVQPSDTASEGRSMVIVATLSAETGVIRNIDVLFVSTGISTHLALL